MMQAKLQSIRQRWATAKQTKSATFWIAIGAILLTLYLGFYQGGWMLRGNAQTMADDASTDAVVERLAPICVAQFEQDPLNAEKLVELRVFTTSSRRASYVTDQGWATMPGQATADNQVAAECARQLLLRDQ